MKLSKKIFTAILCTALVGITAVGTIAVPARANTTNIVQSAKEQTYKNLNTYLILLGMVCLMYKLILHKSIKV